ncbi:hypothetical protein E1A91_D04G106400v1 [Gossypium mustelinum]|uniref:RNA-polymerase II-associated protein 3-like C-terminal domain-containing protein n=1 Tax=Gossypium mustelinum TaxID=34275 RepID=A0A5D2VCA9_GOSMU|nr:hypothetical protein E1A91_D04G106400v1 [Gossypium mustelinum]
MMANKKAACCGFMLMWLLARKLFGKKLSLEQSSFSQQGMEASIKRLLAEKEELAMQLTNSLLEMEEEKAIQCAREKASIEAIEEKRKLYNSQITSLSEKLSEVLSLCRSNFFLWKGILPSQQRKRQTLSLWLKASVQDLASCAASRAMAEAAKSISPPNTAYQFEVSCRALSGDRSPQAHLLKVTSPSALPQIFKNVMSASMLVDIVKCVATFFRSATWILKKKS